MRRTRIVVALLGLILIATALRFYRLQAQDIWGDEAFSISLSEKPLADVIAGGADTHPPLYPVTLLVWLRLVGNSAFATRSLSVLIGILAVPLVYSLARRMAPTRPRVAWFASLLAAVSPLLIYYSQETRMYELVTILSLASTCFFLTLFPAYSEIYTGSPTRKREHWGIAYFVVTLAALYTHYSAFFVLAAENLTFAVSFLRERRKLGWKPMRNWLLLQVGLLFFYIPWILVQSSFLGGKASTRFDEWSWRGVEMIFGKTIIAFGAGLTVDSPIAQIAGAVFLALAIAGCLSLLRQHERLSWLAPVYFVVPVAIAWVLNPVMPFFYERYVLVALPGYYTTIAFGMDAIAGYRVRAVQVAAGIALVVATLVSAFALGQYYWNDAYAKGKYGQMMAYVASQATPGDALILNNPLQKPLFDYYAPKGIPAFYLPDGAPLEDPSTRQRLADIAGQHARLWLAMFGNPAEYDPTGFLARWLGAHSFKTFSRGFVDASLSLYVMPAPSAALIRHPVHATLGDAIIFSGYDLDRDVVAPGQILQLTLHWQARATVDRPYKVFTHLLGAINPATRSPVWAQMDGEPAGGSRPTTGWGPGETIDDLYGLQIPPNAPPGDYAIEIGMYDPATLARLPVRDDQGAPVEDDRILLGTIRIK